jgi:hypothetical protein
MRLSAFDIPRGSHHYLQLPSGRCINVHASRGATSGWDLYVQANSEQWPQEYSDSLVHVKKGVIVFHSHGKNLSHQDIEFLQDTFSKDAANV